MFCGEEKIKCSEGYKEEGREGYVRFLCGVSSIICLFLRLFIVELGVKV